MTKSVFIVTSGCWDDYSIDAVFLDREVADKYCLVHNEVYNSRLERDTKYEEYEVEEWPAGNWDAEEVAREHYVCYKYVDTGEIKSEHSTFLPERPEILFIDYPIPDKPDGGGFFNRKGRKYIGGNSYVSEEHAREIAEDRRGVLLEEKATGLRDENFDKIIEPMTMVGIMQAYSGGEASISIEEMESAIKTLKRGET